MEEILRRKARNEAYFQKIMPLLALASLLLLWLAGYSQTRFLPAPFEILEQFGEFLSTSETYLHIWHSARRLVIGLALGLGAGLLVSFLMGMGKRGERVLGVYVFVALTIPSLAVALISLMLFGLSEVGVYVSVAVITFPFIAVNLREGIKSLDPGQLEMARLYHAGRVQVLREIVIPHMMPYLLSAIRNAHALGWKIVVVAEVFSVRTGIGFQFNRAFDYFRLVDVVIWLIFFLATVMFVEYIVLRRLELHVFAWRNSGPVQRT